MSGTISPDGALDLAGELRVQGPAGELTVSGSLKGSTAAPELKLSGAVRAGFPANAVQVGAAQALAPLRELTDDPGIRATQSQIKEPYGAGSAVDNDPATFGAVRPTTGDSWMEVDLGAQRYMDMAIITLRDGFAGIPGAMVQASKARATATSSADNVAKSTRSITLSQGNSSTYVIPLHTTARYLRIWGASSTSALDIAEISVVGTNADDSVAANWATRTMTKPIANSALHGTDPDVATFADGVVASGTKSAVYTDANSSLGVLGLDLGTSRSISSVDVLTPPDHPYTSALAHSYLVVSDTDISGASKMADIIVTSGVSTHALAGVGIQTVEVNRTGRYVYLVKPEGIDGGIIIGELNVLGVDASSPATGEGTSNLARAASTVITSTGAAAGTSERGAADGKVTSSLAKSAGFEAGVYPTYAYLQFDTARSNFIDSIRLYHRSDDPAGDTFYDAVVLVSEAPFASGETPAAMAQPGVTTYRLAGSRSPALLQLNRLGRYVRIATVRPAEDDALSLAEVEIWGTSASVFEGQMNISTAGISLVGQLTAPCPGGTGSLTFGLNVSSANFAGLDVGANAAISGSCVINGVTAEAAKLSGRLTYVDGQIGFSGGISLTVNGTPIDAGVEIGAGGVQVNGMTTIACASGNLKIDASAGLNANGEAAAGLIGTVGPDGCELTKGISLPAGDAIRGSLVKQADGSVAFKLSAITDISVSAPWLPANATDWRATIELSIEKDRASAALKLASGAGSFSGRINSDGTFDLDGTVSIQMSGTTVSASAHIAKTSPDAEPTLVVQGALDNTVNGVRLAGQLSLEGDRVRLAGSATIPCKTGSITFGVNTVLPAEGDWSLAVEGVTGAAGCQINSDVLLKSATFKGTLGMKAGQFFVDLDGSVAVVTRAGLIPSGNQFGGTFHLNTVGGKVVASVSLTGAGLQIGGTIDFVDAMHWTISANGNLTIQGHPIGFSAVVSMVNGVARYTAGGSIQGPIQLSDNVWLLDGSATISGSGSSSSATFNGRVQIRCSSGDLIASAQGSVNSGGSWDVRFSVGGNNCRFGQNLYLDGNVLSGHLWSSGGGVSGSIDGYVNEWSPAGGVTISNIRLHLEIRDGFHFRGTLSADARVRFTVIILFVPCEKTLGAHIDVNFDIDGNLSGRVGVGISNIQIDWLSIPFQASLKVRLRNGTISGLSLGL